MNIYIAGKVFHIQIGYEYRPCKSLLPAFCNEFWKKLDKRLGQRLETENFFGF